MNNDKKVFLDAYGNDIIQKCAKQYKKLLDTQYKFKIYNKKEKQEIFFTISFPQNRFSHIIGLDHLTSIVNRTKKTPKRFLKNTKNGIYNDAFKGKFDLTKLSDTDITDLCTPVESSYCPSTKGSYTIIDRINSFVNFENMIEFGFKSNNVGIMYPWDPNSCNLKIPGENKTRRSNITADYVLILNSPSPDEEKYNIFLTCTSPPKGKYKNEYDLEANSAFLDGLDFSHGQSKKLITIEVEKIVGKSDPIKIYTNKNFYSTNAFMNNTQNNSKFIKVNSKHNMQEILNVTGGVAVLAPPRPSFGQSVLSFFGGIKQYFDNKRAERQQLIKELKLELSEKDKQLSEKDNQLSDKNEQLSERDKLLSEANEKITDLVKENSDLKQVADKRKATIIGANEVLNSFPKLKQDFVACKQQLAAQKQNKSNIKRQANNPTNEQKPPKTNRPKH